MLYDTHCHLFKEYYEDFDDMIKRAHEAGVDKYIIDADNLESCREVIELSNKYDEIYMTLGIHPEHCDESLEKLESIVEKYKDNNKFVAIGEIGLDYYYGRDNRERQIEVFDFQLGLAEKYNKPVVIHVRNAFDDVIPILKKHKVRGVIHCFSGSIEQYREYEKLDLYIGIGGVITFKNSNLKDVVKDIPMDRILLETDSPYLSPIRGERNEPANIKIIAEFIANLYNVDVDSVKTCQKSVVSKVFDF